MPARAAGLPRGDSARQINALRAAALSSGGSYRYYEITLSWTAGFRAQLAFRVGGDLGVGRPSIYTTASVAGNRCIQLTVGSAYDALDCDRLLEDAAAALI